MLTQLRTQVVTELGLDVPDADWLCTLTKVAAKKARMRNLVNCHELWKWQDLKGHDLKSLLEDMSEFDLKKRARRAGATEAEVKNAMESNRLDSETPFLNKLRDFEAQKYCPAHESTHGHEGKLERECKVAQAQNLKAEAIKQLPCAEKQRAETFFRQRMDSKCPNDGSSGGGGKTVISVEDLEHFADAIIKKIPVTKNTWKNLIGSVDANHDGSVDINEFTVFWAKLWQQSRQNLFNLILSKELSPSVRFFQCKRAHICCDFRINDRIC